MKARRAWYMLVAYVLSLTPALVQAQKRVALIIGAGRYSEVASLSNPTRDARLVEEALQRAGFSDVVRVDDPNRDRFMASLRDFAERADGAEVAFVYYAGHGLEVDGTNWLVPVDARLKSDRDLDFEAVRVESVLGAIKGARVRIVALDACRDNPFVPKMRRVNSTRALSRGLGGVEVDDVLLMYASAAGTTAIDGTGGNSPFARALARWLPEPGLDLRFMAGKVRDQVLAETGGTQKPYVSASLSGEALTLAPARSRSWIGLWIYNVDDYWKTTLKLKEPKGVVVAAVGQRSPGVEAGVREGDVVLRVNGRDVESIESYRARVEDLRAGDRVTMDIVRNGKEVAVTVIPAVRPSNEVIDEIERRLYDMTELVAEQAAGILEDINAVQPKDSLWSSASVISGRLLPFYPGFRLVEISEPARDGGRRARYLHRHPEVVRLNFTSPPMNEVSRKHLFLPRERVVDFAKFFTGNLVGELGRFRIVEKMSDFVWQRPPSEAVLRKIRENLLPLSTQSVEAVAGGSFRLKVSMLYANTLFVTTLEIDRNGIFQMIEDLPIATDLPIVPERW
jgi:hypothetical protein